MQAVLNQITEERETKSESAWVRLKNLLSMPDSTDWPKGSAAVVVDALRELGISEVRFREFVQAAERYTHCEQLIASEQEVREQLAKAAAKTSKARQTGNAGSVRELRSAEQPLRKKIAIIEAAKMELERARQLYPFIFGEAECPYIAAGLASWRSRSDALDREYAKLSRAAQFADDIATVREARTRLLCLERERGQVRTVLAMATTPAA